MKKNDTADLQYGARMALYGIGEIALLALFKAFVGYATGFVVLIADALSSFADMVTLVASYLGLKISQRHADKTFKYGYYKAETFAALITSVVIIYFGFQVLLSSVQHITAPEQTKNQYLALISVGVSTLVSLHLSHFLRKVGKKINSLALVDSGKEKKMDLVVQSGVLAGVAANYFQIPYIGGLIGVAISFIILREGFSTAKESLFFLLDYFNDPKLINKIKKIILSRSRIVKEVKDIRMRRAGTYIFGEAFLEVDPYAQTKDIRSDLKNLQEEITKKNKYLRNFLLFVMIPHPSKVKVAVPVVADLGLQSKIARTIEETHAYIFVDVKDNRIADFYSRNFTMKPNQFQEIINFFENEKVNVVINNDMHSLLFYDLRRLHNIEVYPNFSNVSSVENTVKLLLIDT